MYCKKIQIPLLVLILLIFILTSSLIINFNFFSNQASNIVFDMKSPNKTYTYINPLLDCADSEIDSLRYGNLTDEIENEIEKNVKEGNIGEASIYFRDLNNGPWFGYNEKEEFSPASLMKVPLLIAYLKMSEYDHDLLNKSINSGELDNLISQNIIPAKSIQSNKAYTIRELLDYMIRYSDNLATTVLIQNINPVILDDIYSDLSLKIPSWGNTENYMTVQDYSSFFRILYNASYLNRENSELALEILSESVFNDGLVAGLPKNTSIAHKFGERVLTDSKQLHDCGIVYNEKGDYLICIMTRGQDFNKMKTFLQDISFLVYNSFYQ